MSDETKMGGTGQAEAQGKQFPAADSGVLPPDAVRVSPHDTEDQAWFEDGGRKTALGVWAGMAVLAYAAMQVSGWFADWPFVALVVGAVAYFCVRGVAVALGELSRRSAESAGIDDDDWDVG